MVAGIVVVVAAASVVWSVCGVEFAKVEVRRSVRDDRSLMRPTPRHHRRRRQTSRAPQTTPRQSRAAAERGRGTATGRKRGPRAGGGTRPKTLVLSWVRSSDDIDKNSLALSPIGGAAREAERFGVPPRWSDEMMVRPRCALHIFPSVCLWRRVRPIGGIINLSTTTDIQPHQTRPNRAMGAEAFIAILRNGA